MQYTMLDFVSEWFDMILNKKLQEVAEGKIKKLMIFMHPRIGKSERVSKRLPAWFLGKNPKSRVLCCSNKTELAARFGRQTRSICLGKLHCNVFPKFKLADEKREAGDWETNKGGGYLSAGVGSAIVGSGFELGIIDDPIKTREEVENPSQREKLMEWYKSEFLTRRNPENYRIVLMHQRWHPEDLAGMLLEQEGDEWDVISFPAIDDDGKPLSVKRGFGMEFYTQVKSEIGVRNFAAMYQQDPIAASGNTFKREDFRYKYLSDLDKDNFTVAIHVDPAFSTNKDSDDVGIVVTGKHKITKEIYVLEVLGEPLLPSESYSYILSLAERWKDWTIDFISVEEATLSKDQQDYLMGFDRYMRDQGKFYTLILFKPRGKGRKEDRIRISLEPMFNRHAIYFRGDMKQDKHWIKLEEQLLKFPNSSKDDILDAVSQGVIMWESRGQQDMKGVVRIAQERLTRLRNKRHLT